MHTTFTNGTMFVLKNGLAPCCLTAVLVYPQLVVPTTMFGFGYVPGVVPVSAGRKPKFTSHGPPLEPPHMREPMIVLFAFALDLNP